MPDIMSSKAKRKFQPPSEIIKNFGIDIGRLLRPDILKLEESIFKGQIITLLELQLLHIFLNPDLNPILADHNNGIQIFLRATKITKMAT